MVNAQCDWLTSAKQTQKGVMAPLFTGVSLLRSPSMLPCLLATAMALASIC